MAGRSEGAADLAAQLRWRLESLRAAGVEWLPASLPLPAASASEPAPPERPLALAAGSEAPADGRRTELRQLAERVAGCTRCKELAATRTQTVFGVGRLDPEICFLGEAPGREEDAQGEPFVGPAGQLLTRIIAAMGLTREDVYICNILRCRPPNNRPPAPDEAAHCREWLDDTLGLVRPQVIVALGASAVKYLTGTTTGITRLRGKWLDYRGTPVLCTFHPSYLLRDPTKKREVWEDMKALLTRLGRPIPGK